MSIIAANSRRFLSNIVLMKVRARCWLNFGPFAHMLSILFFSIMRGKSEGCSIISPKGCPLKSEYSTIYRSCRELR